MTPRAPQGFVCLGASAGGLRSLEALLGAMGPKIPWPILVTQHMQVDHESQLAEILGRATAAPVHEATEGIVPLAGHVYTSPSSHELGVSPEGRLMLRPPAPGRPQRVDHLFATASSARPGLVIAVVLSGTGNDGTAGALVVKLNGGTVLAEASSSAEHSGMPSAVVQSGTVDAIRPASELGAIIRELAGGVLRANTEASEAILREIADLLSATTRTDYSGYRLATMRRRVEKRRALTTSRNLQEYLELLRSDIHEREALARSLLIPVTEFFRDPDAWRGLEAEVLPPLVERARRGERVRVWCAGCATGEEAYTIAILFAERLDDLRHVEIVATDLDAAALAAAQEGAYDPSRVRAVDPGRLARFFRHQDARYQVVDALRAHVHFLRQDLTRETPPGPFDLVICRNVLIYFDDKLQAKVTARLRDALRADGTIFLGRSESITFRNDPALEVDRRRIFRTPRPQPGAAPRRRAPEHDETAAGERPLILLEGSSAVILTVDPAWRITSANAAARDMLGDDLAGTHLFDHFPPWANGPVHAALRRSATSGHSVRILGAPGPDGALDLTIEPFPPDSQSLLLVAHAAPERPLTLGEERPPTNDELQTLNEELAAANEELQASNEELQASNEELASLNEEFQSTNENLASVNTELRGGSTHLDAAVLHAILRMRAEALVACDDTGRVLVYNARAEELLGLSPSSVQKPLRLDDAGIPEAELEACFAAARDTMPPVERSVGGWHIRIDRLRAADGAALGWLLTFRPSTTGAGAR